MHTQTHTEQSFGPTYEWAETSELSSIRKAMIELCQGYNSVMISMSCAKLTICH